MLVLNRLLSRPNQTKKMSTETIDLNKVIAQFSEKDQAKLVQFLQDNGRRSEHQAKVLELADTCFNTCITKIKGSLDKADESKRFLR